MRSITELLHSRGRTKCEPFTTCALVFAAPLPTAALLPDVNVLLLLPTSTHEMEVRSDMKRGDRVWDYSRTADSRNSYISDM